MPGPNLDASTSWSGLSLDLPNFRRVPVQPVKPGRTERIIGEMQPGEDGWIVPWAISHGRGKWRGYWLNGGYSVDDQPSGTVKVHIQRDEEGYTVTFDKKTWYDEWKNPSGGPAAWAYLPVKRVNYEILTQLKRHNTQSVA